MKLPILLVVLAVLGAGAPTFADKIPTPYAGQETRAIKALSDEDVTALLNGEGMGLAKAAELNGYPGPAHVLALAPQLQLTAAQREKIQAIFDRMSSAAKPLGAELIDRERVLDRLFASREITARRLSAETAAIAELGGRLRSVHLAAHLETQALLAEAQIAAYQRLRGYEHPGAAHHRPG